jgi:hypothetical protein
MPRARGIDVTMASVRESRKRFLQKHREPDVSTRRALVEGFPYGVFFISDEANNDTSVMANER